MKIVVIGGGAAGFFSALAAKKNNPKAKVTLFERSAKLLSKVRISGGGRCNVTHGCFDLKQLVQNYPRGKRELLGPFHKFGPKDTIEWFESRGVSLKQEKDGRMFPITDSSETIINCFLKEAEDLGVEICTQTKVKEINLEEDRVILATGSSPAGYEIARSFGHTIESPVPSLFTFNIPSFALEPLSGVTVDAVKLKIGKLENTGPLLITHWGFSGPAALKLSAFGARFLAEKKYETTLCIDWIPEIKSIDTQSKKLVSSLKLLPKKLFKALLERANIPAELPLCQLGKASTSRLLEVLKNDQYQVSGKTTNKEEFVTCGGVALSEVNFQTMESKLCKNLFFCGEILDIDGVTGGFNFQNAWTTGWIAGRAASGN